MRINGNVKSISESLGVLGLGEMAEKMEDSIKDADTRDNVVATMAVTFSQYAAERKQHRADLLFKRSKLNERTYFDDLWDYPERKLDKEQIEDLSKLGFISDRRNLLLEGASGTGKSWIAGAIATQACGEGIRTRWTLFPGLLKELRDKKALPGNAYQSRLKYYAKFDLLCIDEFLNESINESDIFIIQELFELLDRNKHSLIICTQCDPMKMDQAFKIQSIGQSVRGRIMQRSKIISLRGPDLRLYKPVE